MEPGKSFMSLRFPKTRGTGLNFFLNIFFFFKAPLPSMKDFPGSMPAGESLRHGAGEGFPKVFGMKGSERL
jgi:hypothetical protein